LIVEDKPDYLKDLKALFESFGFRAIGATSKAAALRELRSTPAVDLVVTDYELNEEDKDKESGSDLKEEIQKIRGDLPIVLYSAKYERRQIGDSLEGFTDILPKSDTAQIGNRVLSWRQEALNYRRKRISFAKNELQRLVEKYEISEQDVAILRDFLPGTDLVGKDADAPQVPPSVDELLRKAGYWLRLIDSQTPVPGEEGDDLRIVVTVPIWLRREENAYVAELYNQPCIYGDGETEKEAVDAVLSLMYGYHRDFADSAGQSFSVDLERLRSYLTKVFG
jgi:CheY-like chemotaxis protein